MRARLQELDVLRALAVLLVLGHHTRPCPETTFLPALLLMKVWQRAGWMGVDLFFVLSGFLVSGLLFREYITHGNVMLGRFLVRRALKIYPSFYVFLLVPVAACWRLGYIPGLHQITAPKLVSEMLFVQNYGPRLWPHTWSLAIEEHFYLLVGLCVYLASKHLKRGENPFAWIPWAFAVIAPALLLMRTWTSYAYPYYWETHTYPTHLRIDSLLFGVVIAYYKNFHEAKLSGAVRKLGWALPAISAVLVSTAALVPLWRHFMHTLGFTCLYAGFGGLLLTLLYLSVPRPNWMQRPTAWLAFGGSHSYSIYLWHYAIMAWTPMVAAKALGRDLPYFASVFAYMTASVAAGIGMAKLVEMPTLAFRDRMFPSRSGAGLSTSARESEPLPAAAQAVQVTEVKAEARD